jgi:hypothetical protein
MDCEEGVHTSEFVSLTEMRANLAPNIKFRNWTNFSSEGTLISFAGLYKLYVSFHFNGKLKLVYRRSGIMQR